MGKPPVIGLDIGTFAVRAVELVPGATRPTLARMGQVTLPPGAVVGGEVVDVAAVGAALTKLWESAGFHSRNVVVGVTGQRVIVRQAEVEAMTEQDLRAGLRYQAQELLPIPVDDAQLDCCVLDHIVADDGTPKMRILLAAAQQEVVASHMDALGAAGLTAMAVDVIPLALLRAFPSRLPDGGSDGGPGGPAPDGPGGSPSPSTEAVVCVGAGLTTVVVREGNVPRFVRVLGVGGDDITAAIGADLGCDADYAEHLKRQAVAAGAGGVATLTRAGALVAEHVRPLVEEIRGSLDFYLAQSDIEQIDRVIVTGGAVNTWGLIDGLRGSLAPEIVISNPLALLDLGRTGLTPAEVDQASPLMAAAVGLALGALPAPAAAQLRINLLPESILVARKHRRQTIAVGVGVLGFAVGLSALWGFQAHQVSSANGSADSAEATVSTLEAKVTSMANVTKAQNDLKAHQQSTRSVLADDVDYQRLLQQIVAVMPDDVWITSFSAQKATKTAPGTVTISASGLSEDSVVRWVRQLGTMPSLTNLWVATTAKSGDAASGGIVTFQSTADLSPSATSGRAVSLTGAAK